MHQGAASTFLLLLVLLASSACSSSARRTQHIATAADGVTRQHDAAADHNKLSTEPQQQQPQQQHDGLWPHQWDDDDDHRHVEFIRHVGRIMLAANPTDNSSSAAAVAVPVDVDAEGTEDQPFNTTAEDPSNTTAGSNSSSALVAMQDRATTDPFLAVAQMLGLHVSPAWIRYYRVRSTRIMLLLADVGWLVYAAGNCAQRLLALLVPVVRIGQTGELTINAGSFLSLGQLVLDFVARFADMLGKALLVVFRGITLAATLPPKT